MSKYLLALDLSIACTGVCLFQIETGALAAHYIIPIKKATKKAYKGLYNIGVHEDEYVSFYSDPEKFHYISETLLTLLKPYDRNIEWVAKESYAYGGSSLSRLAEQCGVCSYRLWQNGHLESDENLIQIAPVSVKKYATGKGKATKDEVMHAVESKWDYPKGYWFSSDDCDAFVIGKIAMMVLNNTPQNKYEKELRDSIIKRNKLELE
jgi:crossover junction endodeoxyribonuclease RuvC